MDSCAAGTTLPGASAAGSVACTLRVHPALGPGCFIEWTTRLPRRDSIFAALCPRCRLPLDAAGGGGQEPGAPRLPPVKAR
eukprot:scaffold1638_cov258-Pinguiococcus_pyrenoidosus.AAC.76